MDREVILNCIEGVAAGAGSAEALSDQDFFRGLYPVANQARTFELNRVLIVGGRGTGKTQMFRALLSDEGREAVVTATGVKLIHDVKKMLFVEAFGAGKALSRADAPSHPSADAIEALVEPGGMRTARQLWLGLSLARLAVDQKNLDDLPREIAAPLAALKKMVGSPRDILKWVKQDVERPFAILDGLDRYLVQHGRVCIFTFDALDRAGNVWSALETAVGGLLSIALDVTRRNHAVRLKVFLRPDLELAGAKSFPDASKLRGYREELLWERSDLYRLTFKRIVSHQDDGGEALDFFRSIVGSKAFREIKPLGMTPTQALDEDAQAAIMTQVVGKYMGTNPKRGVTYTWISNHLADALRRVSPRSFLVAFAEAAQWARRHPEKGTMLPPDALVEGVKKASLQRVEELQEDFEWMGQVRKELEGLMVPCTEEAILDRLDRCKFVKPLPRGLRSAESREVLRQLQELGVFLLDHDGRYNVPDLYRVAMAMKRKGGIKIAG